MTKGGPPILQTAAIPTPSSGVASATQVLYGRIIPPQQQVLLFEAADWESFIQEWVHYQKTVYQKVVRFSGAGDMGIDVAGFCDSKAFSGMWDNYQCKHYAASLTPNVAIPEIAKMLWHSFNGAFVPPRRYYFMAPKGCGMTLTRLLLDAKALKAKLIDRWNDWCAGTITSTQSVSLDGPFKAYVEAFDYSIFSFKTLLEVIDEHRNTPYYAVRFGGGLPDRPVPIAPPSTPAAQESRYIEQLFEAYADHKRVPIADLGQLSPYQDLSDHYHRQREFFYHAESLRNFARDTVPAGTFEGLQDEVHAGVVEVEAASHSDGFARMTAVIQSAVALPLTANGLISVTRIQDKRGICHQLANVNRLRWRKP